MANTLRSDMKTIQSIIYEAYKTSGSLLAMTDGGIAAADDIASGLDKMSGQFESGVVMLRCLCEKNHPGPGHIGTKPVLPQLNTAGKVEVNDYGWLHIELSALLPNCRFQTPTYLADTITRLLDDYERSGRKLPRFDTAMLVIDEHCDIGSRQIYDQDNKGWKAIPNALKGRVIKDDDQYSLGVSLISTKNAKPTCHIYLFPQIEAGDFFNLKHDNYTLFP